MSAITNVLGRISPSTRNQLGALAFAAAAIVQAAPAAAQNAVVDQGMVLCSPIAGADVGIAEIFPPVIMGSGYAAWIPEIHFWDGNGNYMGHVYGEWFIWEPASTVVSGIGARWTQYGGTAGTYKVYTYWQGWIQVVHWVWDYPTGRYLAAPGAPYCRAV